MGKAMFRDVTWAGGLFCLCCMLAGCASVTGSYVDASGSFGLDVQSGGKATLRFRSEERRVGKECRSRWSPYH